MEKKLLHDGGLMLKRVPWKIKKGILIKNINKIKLAENSSIYHAGTKQIGDKIFSNGGRVLNITSSGKNFKKIRKEIIKLIKKINWENGFYRKDIGWRVV